MSNIVQSNVAFPRSLGSSLSHLREIEMDRFVCNENVIRYQKLITISEGDPARDEARYQTLIRLLAEEKAKMREHG